VSNPADESAEKLRQSALQYHRMGSPGKLAIVATKPLTNQRDLSLAYSPGVAAACDAIVADPRQASELTARGNMVAVVTNGTAVLGLGAIGPLAAKPVMEGKAVLFKKFAGIDAIDIEIAENDVDKLVDIIASLEPTVGGINLEDIKAPECFEVEARLRERMNIPVFHDDQHGTAIIVAAAFTNWLRITGRKIEDVKLVASGAGAAALACLDLLVAIGVKLDNIFATDIYGVVYEGRNEGMDARKSRYARKTSARTLAEVMPGADVFLGLSVGGVLTAEMVKTMGVQPLVLALANPAPEIMPDVAKAARPDAIIATGRSDFPNQVNNVLCFPFVFRGALDVGATTVNEAMKLACVQALADLALAEASDIVTTAYNVESMGFGPEYIIPRPFDPRLIVKLAPAVARAAMESGVATRPITDFAAYEEKLTQFVFRSGQVMRPVFARAKKNPARIAFCEGEERRVLQACQVIVDDGLAKPILIGRTEVIETRIKQLNLRLKKDRDFTVTDTDFDPRYPDYWRHYHEIMQRSGVTPATAKTILRTNTSVIGALMVKRGEADAMVCGTIGRYARHLGDVMDVIGLAPGVSKPAALNVLILSKGTYFIADTYVTPDPSPADLCEMTLLAAEEVRSFGIVPKVALVSHSNFGSHTDPSAVKMRLALEEIRRRAPQLEVEGEMHADAALSEDIRHDIFPNSRLKGEANLLIMPSLDAANIAFNMMKVLGDGLSIGPILLGAAQPAHIVTPSVTVRGLVNIAAVAGLDSLLAAESPKIQNQRLL
jgi:malate dehydrogenase (oxaloacetate-decarboxylating)(NADP+)